MVENPHSLDAQIITQDLAHVNMLSCAKIIYMGQLNNQHAQYMAKVNALYGWKQTTYNADGMR